MDRGGAGRARRALRGLPGRCMQCPGGGSAHHAGIKKPPSGGLAVGRGGYSLRVLLMVLAATIAL